MIAAATRYNFADLMRVFEVNHAWAHLLLPSRRIRERHFISGERRAAPLFVEILERHRYTSVVRMSYFFPSGPEPDAHVRLYHDARLAELTHWTLGESLRSVCPVPWGPEALHDRLRANIFLGKWLAYLAQTGHSAASLRASARRLPGTARVGYLDSPGVVA